VTAGKRAHGTRVKYVHDSCRCADCTAANTAYVVELGRETRARAVGYDIEPRLIDAQPAVERLKLLRRNGIGARTVEELTGISRSTLREITSGQTKRIRPDTLDLIMQVTYDDRPGGTQVDARPTWQLINKLLRKGFTKVAIATAIAGKPTHQLQISKHLVTLRIERRVQQVYIELLGEELEHMQRRTEAKQRQRAKERESQHV
jgi:transcriptional regulator with XRE-family HTH domain